MNQDNDVNALKSVGKSFVSLLWSAAVALGKKMLSGQTTRISELKSYKGSAERYTEIMQIPLGALVGILVGLFLGAFFGGLPLIGFLLKIGCVIGGLFIALFIGMAGSQVERITKETEGWVLKTGIQTVLVFLAISIILPDFLAKTMIVAAFAYAIYCGWKVWQNFENDALPPSPGKQAGLK